MKHRFLRWTRLSTTPYCSSNALAVLHSVYKTALHTCLHRKLCLSEGCSTTHLWCPQSRRHPISSKSPACSGGVRPESDHTLWNDAVFGQKQTVPQFVLLQPLLWSWFVRHLENPLVSRKERGLVAWRLLFRSLRPLAMQGSGDLVEVAFVRTHPRPRAPPRPTRR